MDISLVSILLPINLNQACEADKRITRNVREALKLVDIELLDHLIVNKDEEFATII